jgi:tRNA threonylcarbamoyladenosine biosynthesis protein TsaE
MIYTDINKSDLQRIANEILGNFSKERIFLFQGEMGAGKTTFIKEFCKVLGVKDEVSSPTFSIVNVYLDKAENQVFHFDFYRINSKAEAIDIGLYEYLYSGSFCFIEWPQLIEELLPESGVVVNISLGNTENTRNFEITEIIK